MKKHSILLIIASVLLAMTATSCDDYLDVNTNKDAPDYVEGYLYLAGIEQAYQGLYYDIRATSRLTQVFGGAGYSNYAMHSYTANSDAAGEIWRTVYWLQGMNLENMINQSLEKENWTLAGIGYIIKAYSWDAMTKEHGELPLEDAFKPGLLTHHYDYQDAVYEKVREWAKTGIELLQRDDATNYGTKISGNDYIYKGDKQKWIKFGYAVLVRNLASLTNKNDFKDKYYAELVDAASKAFSSNADNATVTVGGGAGDAAQSSYNNFWGPFRGNLSTSYVQSDWATQVFTGTVPYYDADGNKVTADSNIYAPYELAPKQIICDTTDATGHYDPRVAVKLATTDSNNLATIPDLPTLRSLHYYGGGFASMTGSVATAPTLQGRESRQDDNDGDGRWLYRNDAPYILATYSEILFDLAEAQFKCGSKTEAFETWKKAIAADMEFTASYLVAGKVVTATYNGKEEVIHQGDKVTKALFNQAAQEYLNGPYVAGLSMADFDLSHIMMQKFVALYPWGSAELWVDQRKYMYDIVYTGEYPTFGNGWDMNTLNQKRDEDPTKVYKGLYLPPAQVQNRRSAFNEDNNGSPCFRLRPRYNSEYMWNKEQLSTLKPISGMAKDYQCSIPWFAYPGDIPK